MVHDPDAVLSAYGWDERIGALAEPHQAAGRAIGRVVTVERGHDTVVTAAGELRLERAHPAYRSAGHASPPAVGDWVAIATDEGGPAIVAVLERQGTLSRRDPAVRDVEQVVAANVDLLAVVMPLDRPVRAARLERALVMAHEGGVAPLVVLSKADLAKQEEASRRLVAETAPTVPVVVTSTVTGAGLDELRGRLERAGTAALVGESGAGKSSLVNALVGAPVQEVAEVRARDRKGRHTTIARRLFRLPGGGTLIDTPGVRALGVWSEEGTSVDEAFPDIVALAESCRFRDCTHRQEPGCAVLAAVAAGTLDAERLDRYQTLADEYDSLERRREQAEWRGRRSARRRR